MDYVKGSDGVTRPIVEHVLRQESEILSLKMREQELLKQLQAIELRLANVEDPRTRTK